MKKIRLVGKKLYRVGPLKCYKDNHHGHGSGGMYSSSRPQGYGSGSGGGAMTGGKFVILIYGFVVPDDLV